MILGMTPKAQSMKAKTDKWGIHQILKLCSSKNTINSIKDNLRMGEDICKSGMW